MNIRDENAAAYSAILLLLLTSWGNAPAMLICSGLGCAVGLAVWRGPGLRYRLAVAGAACLFAMVAASVLVLGRLR